MNRIMITATTVDRTVTCELKHNGHYQIRQRNYRNEARFPLLMLCKCALALYWRDAVERLKKIDWKKKLAEM